MKYNRILTTTKDNLRNGTLSGFLRDAFCFRLKRQRASLNVSIVYLLLVIAPLFSAHPVVNEIYTIDTQASEVKWKCSMVFADKGGHNGFISISMGDLRLAQNQLVGGAVEIDMNTIADEHHGTDNGLVKHLKDPDFFDVKKFPFSTFAITRVSPAESGHVSVTGNMTIKGVTHEITFPAKVEVKGRVVNATGKVVIDRTKWDVRYGSGKFFFNLADEAISDFIELDMMIVAMK